MAVADDFRREHGRRLGTVSLAKSQRQGGWRRAGRTRNRVRVRVRENTPPYMWLVFAVLILLFVFGLWWDATHPLHP